MVAFKAIQCWLRLKLSDKAPQNWADKRKKIDDSITNLTRGPNKEATIEEVSKNEEEEYKIEKDRPMTVKNLGRMEIGSRSNDIKKVIEYNILKRKKDENIQNWKSYPGVSKIIDIARDVVERGNIDNIAELARMMQCHESQQSASVIATIAILVGNKIGNNVDAEYRKAIGDVILWNTPVIQDKDTWPPRKKYSFRQLFRDKENLVETKKIVH